MDVIHLYNLTGLQVAADQNVTIALVYAVFANFFCFYGSLSGWCSPISFCAFVCDVQKKKKKQYKVNLKKMFGDLHVNGHAGHQTRRNYFNIR